MNLDPLSKLSQLFGSPHPLSSVTYFMDGPEVIMSINN